MSAAPAEFPLQVVVQNAIERHHRAGWTLQEQAFWCQVRGPERGDRIQGWKLHLSATVLTAPMILHAAAEVLLPAGCPFKFAKDLGRVEELTSARYERAQAGKFIAAYPRDEDEFHRLAAELCDATVAMPGPRILSDRPYRPGSVVQYRFGAFTGVPTLTNDGCFEARLQAPDGSIVPDPRKAWFAPPHWVSPIVPAASPGAPAGSTVNPPAPAAPPASPASSASKPARPRLADGRYEVHEAIRHSARGGVYRAIDTSTGATVLIKEARAHIGTRRDGLDARARLGHEAEALKALAPLTPALLGVFQKSDHAFLVEEYVAGHPLAEHIARLSTGQPDPATVDELRQLALGIVALVQDVHQRGWVLRDVSSMNVMLTADRGLVLIDPEYAARPGETVARVYTPGFAAPEVMAGPVYGPAPGPSADAFSVGAVLIHLALGAAPVLLADQDADRPLSDRIAALLALAAPDRPLVQQWWPVLIGLTAPAASRWTLAQAADFLAEPDRAEARPVSLPVRPDDLIDRIIDDGLDQLVATMNPDGAWLWPSEGFGATTDPLNVQYGAAGVLRVLQRAAVDRQHAGARDALGIAAGWIADRLERAERVLPGLYFGRAGTGWALREAAEVLADDQLAARAEAFALRLPVSWPNPDICHGLAGSGFAQLRFWQLTGRAEFLQRAQACADGLLAARQEAEDGTFWPVPREFDSVLAGATHFGFAHGVAGVGAFLLAVGQASADRRYLDLADAAGRTLVMAADVDAESGAAIWPTDRQRPAAASDMRFHWCSGSSGVGTFLTRLEQAQSDPIEAKTYRGLVHGAGIAVHRARWSSPTAICHGLAGNAQFLLDAAAAAGDREPDGPDRQTYQAWAQDLAAVIAARHAIRGGRLIVPDDSAIKVSAGYSTGSAGVLDLLLRLRHGGPRLWMIESSS